MCVFRNQIRSERLEFWKSPAQGFYVGAIVYEMRWNQTTLTFDVWIKGYRKASKNEYLVSSGFVSKYHR